MPGPVCSRCKQLTWPEAWCECDPRLQISDFYLTDCVILMPDENFEEQREHEEATRAATPIPPPPDELAPRRRRQLQR